MVELAGALVGGGKSDDTIQLDTGEGMEELTEEQIQEMRTMLGETDFARLYPDYV